MKTPSKLFCIRIININCSQSYKSTLCFYDKESLGDKTPILKKLKRKKDLTQMVSKIICILIKVMPTRDALGNSSTEESCRYVKQEEPGHFWS